MMSGFKNRIAPTLAALVMATSASVALTQPAVASDNVDNSSHKSMSENARLGDGCLAGNRVSFKD